MDEQKSHKERFPSGGPLVSIVTPTLNSESFIEDNIRSIRSQTYPNIEHVIVDGVSTDSTLDIVKKLDPDAVVISEKDRGISDAFNKGLRLAKGDIIAILNSDDYYADERAIEKVVQVFRTRPETDMLYGKVRCVDQQTGHTLVIYGEPFSFRKTYPGDLRGAFLIQEDAEGDHHTPSGAVRHEKTVRFRRRFLS